MWLCHIHAACDNEFFLGSCHGNIEDTNFLFQLSSYHQVCHTLLSEGGQAYLIAWANVLHKVQSHMVFRIHNTFACGIHLVIELTGLSNEDHWIFQSLGLMHGTDMYHVIIIQGISLSKIIFMNLALFHVT